MKMTLSEINAYLNASRAYLESAQKIVSRMGWYCPNLNRMLTRQEELERLAWRASRGQNLGWFWLVAAAGSVAAYLGSYVYKQYAESKMQADYLKCLETYTNRGISPEMAADICAGNNVTPNSNLEKSLKMVVYGGIIIMALYFGTKLISKVKK